MTKFKILNSDSSDKKIEKFIAEEIVKICKKYVEYRGSKEDLYLNMSFLSDEDEGITVNFNNSYYDENSIDNVKKINCFGAIKDE